MKEIIQEGKSLPVEERAIVIDSLLRTLNPPSEEIDAEWKEVAKRRLAELRSGRAKAVPGMTFLRKFGRCLGSDLLLSSRSGGGMHLRRHPDYWKDRQ
ncbi:MAG: addiction module protein [Nitrospiraceae bacterium]|nr:addiction module protein [Nitrospiraceae bacterium]